jgi:hypothetical protein
MGSHAFAIIVRAIMLVSFLPAAASAQPAETRAPRPEVVYDDAEHFVMNSNRVHDNGYEGTICIE